MKKWNLEQNFFFYYHYFVRFKNQLIFYKYNCLMQLFQIYMSLLIILSFYRKD